MSKSCSVNSTERRSWRFRTGLLTGKAMVFLAWLAAYGVLYVVVKIGLVSWIDLIEDGLDTVGLGHSWFSLAILPIVLFLPFYFIPKLWKRIRPRNSKLFNNLTAEFEGERI